jgi:hypothetical protein
MSLHFTMDDFPRDNALGSFEDLLQHLEDLDHDSPREPLRGMAFKASPAQYLTLLQMETRSDPGPSDYSCGVVNYKNKTTSIHLYLSQGLAELMVRQIAQKWAGHSALPPDFGTCFSSPTEVRDKLESPTVNMAPDVAIFSGMFGELGNRGPRLVVEIAYAHRFTRDKLEARYKEYFRNDSVQVVLCLDLFYARGPDRASETASALDRSAISMWIRDENGDSQTVMD